MTSEPSPPKSDATLAESPPVAAQPARLRPATLAPASVRLIALAIVLGGGTLLGIAAWLQPDDRGYGTHEQLPMQGPCGFLLRTGYPCPTCGMTTAFAHTVRGQLVQAAMVQPAGLILALTLVVAVVVALRSLVTGRPPALHRWGLSPFRVYLGLLIVLLGGWAVLLVIGRAMGQYPVG